MYADIEWLRAVTGTVGAGHVVCISKSNNDVGDRYSSMTTPHLSDTAGTVAHPGTRRICECGERGIREPVLFVLGKC